jgi:hypothetical protein
MSYEHGNWDFDHGCIKPEDDNADYQFSPYNIKDVLERNRIMQLWKSRNQNRYYDPAHQIAYGELFERNHGAKY